MGKGPIRNEGVAVTPEQMDACRRSVDKEVADVRGKMERHADLCPEDQEAFEKIMWEASGSSHLCYRGNIEGAHRAARRYLVASRQYLEEAKVPLHARKPCNSEETAEKHKPRIDDFNQGPSLHFDKMRFPFILRQDPDESRQAVAALIEEGGTLYLQFKGEKVLYPLEGFDRWSFKGIRFPKIISVEEWAIYRNAFGDLDEFLRVGVTLEQLDLGEV